MTKSPTERLVQPVVDLTATDADALVELGVLDPQPEPEAPPPIGLLEI